MKENNPNPPNQYRKPFDDTSLNIKCFLEEVKASSQLSRKVLVILAFASLFIFMTLANSFPPHYNWFKSKQETQYNVGKYFYFMDDTIADTPVDSLGEFIYKNEKAFKTDTVYLADRMVKDELKFKSCPHFRLKSPHYLAIDTNDIDARFIKYKEISEAINYALQKHVSTRKQLDFMKEEMFKSKIEHIDFVRVPILGISFDMNYLGIYSGLLIFGLYWLFYAALQREYVNTKIAFKQGWISTHIHHFTFYEFMSMSQVFRRPEKLFEAKESNFHLLNVLSWSAICSGAIVTVLVVGYDVFFSIKIGNMLSNAFTGFSSVFEIALFFLVSFLLYKVILQRNKIKYLWDNRTLEFNFEFIVTCALRPNVLNEKQAAMLRYADSILIQKNDMNSIKRMCHQSMMDIKLVKEKIRLKQGGANFKYTRKYRKKVTTILKEYINAMLGRDFERVQNDPGRFQKEVIEYNWLLLTKNFDSLIAEDFYKNSFYVVFDNSIQNEEFDQAKLKLCPCGGGENKLSYEKCCLKEMTNDTVNSSVLTKSPPQESENQSE